MIHKFYWATTDTLMDITNVWFDSLRFTIYQTVYHFPSINTAFFTPTPLAYQVYPADPVQLFSKTLHLNKVRDKFDNIPKFRFGTNYENRINI